MELKITIEWEVAEPIDIDKPALSRMWERLRGGDPDQIEFDQDSAWVTSRVLYAYADPEENEILYLGKVWSGDVWKRFVAQDKDKVWDLIRNELGLERRDVDVLVGTPKCHGRSRLTKETLAYLESLLIWHLEPDANIQSTRSFKRREGTVIRCIGDWPYKQATFVDE